MTLMQFVRIEIGLIAEGWEQFNQLSMLQQIGGDPNEGRRLAPRLGGRGLRSRRVRNDWIDA